MKTQFTELKSSLQYGSDIYFIIKMILKCPLCICLTAFSQQQSELQHCNGSYGLVESCVIFFRLTSSFLMVALNTAQQRNSKSQHSITQIFAVLTGVSFPLENWTKKSHIMADFKKNFIASEC